jgi:DNA-binding beta-propeller fold protein YncE
MKRSTACLVLLAACGSRAANGGDAIPTPASDSRPAGAPTLPLVLVADVELPGNPVRFDYQDFDAARNRLVIAHMDDATVVVVNASDGSVVKVVPDIPHARGVAVAPEAGRIFVTGSPDRLVILDAGSLAEIGRVATGTAPDGVAWDPQHRIVGVSDQRDGAVSLIADAGDGARRQVRLGVETGNVRYDPQRALFWVTVVGAEPPDRLAAVDPVAGAETASLPLPGCAGAHGLRLHPDGGSAFAACEENAKVVRVDLATGALEVAATGAEPDVLAIDPGLGWLYVAAESGDLTVFDIGRPGLVRLDEEHPGDGSHTVEVDPATHRVFFPLASGAGGKPVLRILRPGP